MKLSDKLRQHAQSCDSCKGVSDDMMQAAQLIDELSQALHSISTTTMSKVIDYYDGFHRCRQIARETLNQNKKQL